MNNFIIKECPLPVDSEIQEIINNYKRSRTYIQIKRSNSICCNNLSYSNVFQSHDVRFEVYFMRRHAVSFRMSWQKCNGLISNRHQSDFNRTVFSIHSLFFYRISHFNDFICSAASNNSYHFIIFSKKYHKILKLSFCNCKRGDFNYQFCNSSIM